jgi:DNA-binding MarR family transcriptional regulator
MGISIEKDIEELTQELGKIPGWARKLHHLLCSVPLYIDKFIIINTPDAKVKQPGFSILYTLVTSGGSLQQKRLMEILERSKQAVAAALSNLEKQGMITRAMGHDRRERVVHITEKGLRFVRETLPHRRQYFNCIISSISETEGQQFIDILERFRDRL